VSSGPDENYFPAAEADTGWRRAAPRELGLDAALLADAISFHDEHEAATAQNGGALIVVYQGHVVAETYVTGRVAGPQPWTPETCNDIKSATKSVFGTAAGLWLDEYRERVDLDTPLVGSDRSSSLIPQIWDQPLTDGRKSAISVRHALSMTSGHDTREPWLAPSERHHFTGYDGVLQMHEYCFGWWHFDGVPDQHTLLFEPGTDFNYSNYGLELVALAMRNISAEEIGPYLHSRVLSKMGLATDLGANNYLHMPYNDDNEWNFSNEAGWGRGGSAGCNAYGADGNPSPYGYNNVVGSTFRCSARDFARLGYLWLRSGRWGEQQLVPAEWLDLATSRHRRDDGTQPENYGYTFWIQDEWEGVPADTFMARGHNLNDCYVVPSLDLVVARQGNANPDRTTAERFSHELIRRIVSAVPTHWD